MKLPPRALVSLLASKSDWQIPQEKHLGILHDTGWAVSSKSSPDIQISACEKYPTMNDRIRIYMKDTFYKTAPIPIALGLSKSSLCKETNDLVDKEIIDAIDSGASLLFTKLNDKGSSEIVGCWLNQIWTRNKSYDIIGANARLWHHAASEVVTMDENTNNNQHLLWRKLQFLHIYDLGQVLLNQMPEKKFVVYLGAGFVDERVRESDIMQEAFHIIQNEWNTRDCIIFMFTTFSKMEPYIQRRLNNPTVIDEMKYEDQTLEVDGVRCFKSCEHLGGIKFIVNFNKQGADNPDYNWYPSG